MVQWKQCETFFFSFGGGVVSKITADGDCNHEIKRCLPLGRKVMTNLDSILKSRDITLLTKVCLVSQGYGFSCGHVWMWELDCEESRVPTNWCFWTVVLEKTLESSLDSEEIKSVNPKGYQPWKFTGRLMLKLQYFGQLMQRANSLEKTLMLGRVKAKEEEWGRGWDD